MKLLDSYFLLTSNSGAGFAQIWSATVNQYGMELTCHHLNVSERRKGEVVHKSSAAANKAKAALTHNPWMIQLLLEALPIIILLEKMYLLDLFF